MGWRTAVGAVALGFAAAWSASPAAAQDFSISAGTSTRAAEADDLAFGTQTALTFAGGTLRAAWADNSAALAGNPDGSLDIATARIDGTIAGPNVNASAAAGHQRGPALAVHPADPRHLVIAAAGPPRPDDPWSRTIFRAVSRDGGQTWRGGTAVAAGSLPHLAFDGFGNLFMAYVDDELLFDPRVRLLVSPDGGETFARVAGFAPQLPSGDQPRVAAAPGAVWVAWAGQGFQARLGGAPVSGPGQVGAFVIQEAPDSASAERPDLAVGAGGRVLLSYQRRPTPGPVSPAISTHVDPDGLGPAPLGARSDATNFRPEDNEAMPRLAYDAARGRAYLVYQDVVFDGSRPDFAAPTKDVLVRVSSDDGRTWTPAQPVNSSVPSPDRLLPAAAFDAATARLAVVWHDFREGGARLFGRVFASVERPPQPNAPLNLRATPVSRTQVDLAWTDASDDETGFEIRRALGSVVTAFRVGAGTTTFSDTGLPEDTAVTYVVRALNGAGFSTASNVRTTRTLAPPPAPPSAPADLRAEAVASSQIRLTWRDTSANEQMFEVERSVAGGSFVPVVTALPPGTTSFLDGGLRRRTTYAYRVRACNAGGCSAYAGPASATTLRR